MRRMISPAIAIESHRGFAFGSTTIASDGTPLLDQVRPAHAAFGEDRVAARAARGQDAGRELLLVQVERMVQPRAQHRAKGGRDTRPRPAPG